MDGDGGARWVERARPRPSSHCETIPEAEPHMHPAVVGRGRTPATREERCSVRCSQHFRAGANMYALTAVMAFGLAVLWNTWLLVFRWSVDEDAILDALANEPEAGIASLAPPWRGFCAPG